MVSSAREDQEERPDEAAARIADQDPDDHKPVLARVLTEEA
jgi:hypothetical protein